MQGGFLLSITRETAYQADLRAGDRVLFSTDMGWIMGPWTVTGAMACGATVVFMEGAPDWPYDRLWKLVEEERVTMLGISPTLVRALIPHGEPDAELSSLRTVVTTGEPWNRGPYDWLDEHVCGKGRIPIVELLGGHRGRSVLPLGDDARADEGVLGRVPGAGRGHRRLRRRPGAPSAARWGSSSASVAWPGMTRGIWGDPERYLDTYWRRFPGVWTHGDWASVDEDGYWFLHGRSDDTLNIAGKRIGPAELESAAVGHPAVSEAAAIGIPHEVKGEVAWLYCVLAPGAEASPQDVTVAVARELGKAFAPDRVDLRVGPAEDAKRQGRAACRASPRARPRSRRPLHAREPRGTRGDRTCRLTRLEGVALVTGGGRGIGASIARELADAGMRVAVTGRTRQQVEAVAAEIGGLALAGDVSQRADARVTGSNAPRATLGPIELLVAMQGITAAASRSTWRMPVEEWWHVLEVNVLGVTSAAEASSREWLARGRVAS